MRNYSLDMEDSGNDLSKSHGVLISVTSICLLIVEISGIICNSVILMIYYKYSRLRTATNLFILNLALCNLLLAMLDIIFSVPSTFNRKWQYESLGCSAYGFGYLYLMTVAVCTLAVISFDRFCVITKPVRNLRTFMLTKKHAWVLILFIHAYSLAFTLPPLVGWNELVLDEHFQTGCYINYSDNGAVPLAYIIVSTVFTSVVPFILTTCCYAKIYRSVEKRSKRSSVHNRAKQKIIRGDSAANLTKLRRKSPTHTRTARMIAVVMFFFLLSWLPFKVTGLCRAFGVDVPPLVVYFSVLSAKSCVMYNAVVYVFLNHRFRAAFLHLTFLCRDESRLRLTTSVTNHSGRFGDLGVSVSEHCGKKPRVLTRQNLSQLSIIPVGATPDVSSTSGKSSTEIPKVLDGLRDRGVAGFASMQGNQVIDVQIGNTRVAPTNGACVNDALENSESGKSSFSEEPYTGEQKSILESINEGSIRDFYCGNDSSERLSGTCVHEDNIALGDEGISADKFVELNVNSLGNVGYV